MKKPFLREHLKPALYAMAVIAFALVFLLVAVNFRSIWANVGKFLSIAKPILYGAVISLVLLPLVRRNEALCNRLFCKKKPHPRLTRVLSIFASELFMIVILGVIVVLLIPMLSENYSVFSKNLESYVYYAQMWIREKIILSDALLPYYNTFIKQLEDGLFGSASSLTQLVPQIAGIVMNVLSETWHIILGVIISVYLLLSRKTIFALFHKVSAAIFPEKFHYATTDLLTRLYTNFTEFFSARVIDSLIVGLLCYVFCWVTGVPFYGLVAFVVAITNVIPIFGPIIGIVFGTLMVLLVKPELCGALLIVLLAIHLADYLLIEPRLLSRRLRVGVMAELLLLLISYAIGGVLAVVFAIPLYVTLRAPVIGLCNQWLRKRELPTDSYLYQNAFPDEEIAAELDRLDREIVQKARTRRARRRAARAEESTKDESEPE